MAKPQLALRCRDRLCTYVQQQYDSAQLISFVTTCLCIFRRVAEVAEIEMVVLIDVSFTCEAPQWSAIQGSLPVCSVAACGFTRNLGDVCLTDIKAQNVQSTHAGYEFTC